MSSCCFGRRTDGAGADGLRLDLRRLGKRSRGGASSIPEGYLRQHVMMVTTAARRTHGPHGPRSATARCWSSHDTCFYPVPHIVTMLTHRVTSEGAHGGFRNMSGAYDKRPPGAFAPVEGATVLQVYDYNRTAFDPQRGTWRVPEATRSPSFIHPPLRASGRRSMLNRTMTARIEGWTRPRAIAIRRPLFDIAETTASLRPRVALGDSPVWDNRSSTPARTDFPPEENRI